MVLLATCACAAAAEMDSRRLITCVRQCVYLSERVDADWSKYTGASTLEQVHWSKYTGASTLEQVHWSKYTGASTWTASQLQRT
jgi:hypothetical protein